MGTDFPSEVEELNETDFDIIKCLYESGSLWKMEITRQVNKRRSEGRMLVDRSESITKQAISRRVERLHELGYLESSIISLSSTDVEKKPDRDFIEGYRVNGKAEEALENITKLILRDVVSKAITSEQKIPQSALEDYLELYSDLKEAGIDSLVAFVKLETRDRSQTSE